MALSNNINLIDSLPKVRGRYTENADLSKITWFRVGGMAEVLYKPADIDDLSFFLSEKPADVPITVLGVGSNVLIREGGVPGVVIRLGRGFNNIYIEGETIDVGAGVLDRNVAMACANEGLSNMEFLCGVPGTIGGALRMNAGCYGSEIKDILEHAVAMDPSGKLHQLTSEECQFGYRTSGVPDDWIFISARFKGNVANSNEIHQKINELLETREKTQPVKTRTGGSTFANPPGQKAWELIDQAKCRGMELGGAKVSELHCNFLINTGEATATDLEDLAETVRYRVKQTSGVELHWEIKRIGEYLAKVEKKAQVI